MKFQGALIKEQGVTFAIVVVNRSALQSPMTREQMQLFGHQVFGAIPIVLAAEGLGGTMKYWGRKDIVAFLSQVPVSLIPWKQYTVGVNS
nr:hypothetical protein [uncultured Agathobaculum sp.]